jgi:hypothetical protein
MQTPTDWKLLHDRARELIQTGSRLVNLIWQNLQVASSQSRGTPGFADAILGLRTLLSETILPAAHAQLASASYEHDAVEFKAFFESARQVQSDLTLDLRPQWNAMVRDISDWASSGDDVWDMSDTPGVALRFVNIVKEHQGDFLQFPQIKESLNEMLDQIQRRAREDAHYADEVPYEDQVANRADACTQLGRTFEQFGKLDEAERLRSEFLALGSDYEFAAKQLLEQVPEERDEYDDSYSPQHDREVDVTELFRDL